MRMERHFITPDYSYLDENGKKFALELSEILKRIIANIYQDLVPNVSVLPDLDTTPSVKNGHNKVYIASNSGATAITDFDEAEEGQKITIITTNGNTSIADATNFKLSAAWAPNADDSITLAFYNSIWVELSRSAN